MDTQQELVKLRAELKMTNHLLLAIGAELRTATDIRTAKVGTDEVDEARERNLADIVSSGPPRPR